MLADQLSGGRHDTARLSWLLDSALGKARGAARREYAAANRQQPDIEAVPLVLRVERDESFSDECAQDV